MQQLFVTRTTQLQCSAARAQALSGDSQPDVSHEADWCRHWSGRAAVQMQVSKSLLRKSITLGCSTSKSL